MSSKEHRRSPRRKVAETVLVSDVMTEEIVGRIGNLSETGMLLIASVPLLDDALYQLRFHLPGRNPALNTGVHLLWSVAANTPGQSWCGFRFVAVSDEQRGLIRDWVQAGEDTAAT